MYIKIKLSLMHQRNNSTEELKFIFLQMEQYFRFIFEKVILARLVMKYLLKSELYFLTKLLDREIRREKCSTFSGKTCQK